MRTTLGDLKTRALRMADTPAVSATRSDAVLVDAELTDEANKALGFLHDLLLASYESYFRATALLEVSAGSEWTKLPEDFRKLRALYLIQAGERYECLPYDVHGQGGMTLTETTDWPRYELEGNGVRWSKPLSSTRQLEVKYIRGFRPLLLDTDEVDPEIPETYDSYVVASIAAYALAKQERDPSFSLLERDRVAEKIRSLSLMRDQARPMQVRDTSRRFDFRQRRHFHPWPRKV